MPFAHGKATGVYLGGFDLSPYLNMAEAAVDIDTADTTTFGSTWKQSIIGTEAAKATFGGFYDPGVLDIENTLTVDFALTSGVLTYCPAGGATIGNLARLMSATSGTYAQTSPIGGAVAVKWEAAISAGVGFGQVLHPYGTDTDTTTGSEKDDLAATTTGWVAHLHVAAQNATSWVVKLQDAAVSNTYTDVTGGAFTAVTTKSGQRLLSASGATLRRYVRYVATRTGGSAASTITFQLSYARNQ